MIWEEVWEDCALVQYEFICQIFCWLVVVTLKLFQPPTDVPDVYTPAFFWQQSIHLSVSSGALCSKLLSIAHVNTVSQTLAFHPSLIKPSHCPDRKLASPTASAVICSRFGPGSFIPFWWFQLPSSGYVHTGVSKPVCM